jgi:hypothetical protein
MKPSFLVALLTLQLSASTALAQTSHPRPPGVRQADQAEAQTEKDIPPPIQRRAPVDLAKLVQEANELARIAQIIPSDVADVQKGMLPKDVILKLKQIEKLSKRLSSELGR